MPEVKMPEGQTRLSRIEAALVPPRLVSRSEERVADVAEDKDGGGTGKKPAVKDGG